jgi:hypothetical protein
MQRVIVAFMASLILAGCGLGETAVVAAAGGTSEAEQAKQALRMKERAQRRLDAATGLDAQRREDSETGTQQQEPAARRHKADDCTFSACASAD